MTNPPKSSATSSPAPKAKKATGASNPVPDRAGRTGRAGANAKVATQDHLVPGAEDSGAPDTHPAAFWEGRRPGRMGQGRGIYNRRIQRSEEHWPLPARLVSWLFRRPDLVLALLGDRQPIAVNGRVLNRNVQAMLAVSRRLERFTLGAADEGLGDPVAMRRQLRRMALLAMPIRTDVHGVGRVIPAVECPPGSDGIPVRIYRRFGIGAGAGVGLGSPPPAIVYYHGGGWVTGDLVSHDASCRLLAAVSRCVVVAVDYRLAPEHPFPAAVDDALAAYGWVCAHAEELGIAPGRIGVMGDSAGGNLAAAVSLLIRPGGRTAGAKPPTPGSSSPAGSSPSVPTASMPLTDLPAPFAQGLIYPALTTSFDSESMQCYSEGFFLTMQSMKNFRGAYLPDREDWESETASPLMAGDLHGVAPALVVTAGFDPLHDDGEAYAARLKEAGVDVEYRCYDDQVHGFFGMGILADSLALSTEVCDVMGRLMHRPGR